MPSLPAQPAPVAESTEEGTPPCSHRPSTTFGYSSIRFGEQLFYNTGITTYVWLLTNRKEERRRGKVQLIDASSLWVPMRRSLGDKRREISPEHIAEITAIHEAFAASDRSKIFATTDFGYRKITVERPLRLNFQASPERIGRLDGEKAF